MRYEMGWKEKLKKALGPKPGSPIAKQMKKIRETKKAPRSNKFGERSLAWANVCRGWSEIGLKTKIKVIFLIAVVGGMFAFAIWWILFWVGAGGG